MKEGGHVQVERVKRWLIQGIVVVAEDSNLHKNISINLSVIGKLINAPSQARH